MDPWIVQLPESSSQCTNIAPRRMDEPPQPSGSASRKRGGNALAACKACRHRKSRCNAARPTCTACARRGQRCEYDVEPGLRKREFERRKLNDLRSEHEELQDVVRLLRDGGSEHVDGILQRLRRGEIDGIEATDEDKQMSLRELQDLDIMTGDEEGFGPSPGSGSVLNSPASTDNSSVTRLPHMVLPSKQSFEIAICAYHRTAGGLFYTYMPTQSVDLLEDVFGAGKSEQGVGRLAQLCGIAAVGSMYEQVPSGSTDSFYNIARQSLDALIEEDDLSAIKLVLLLALCNISYKSTTAMTYLNTGLFLIKKRGLHKASKPTDIDTAKWLDYRRVWRTLTLFIGWITCTTGIPANIDCPENPIVFETLGFGLDLGDTIQSEMAKMATLKATMVGQLTGPDNLDSSKLSQARESLRHWYDQLPRVMTLNSLLVDDIVDSGDRVKILYVHLLYLDGLMLLPRLIASRGIETEDGVVKVSSSDAITGFNEGFMAAPQVTRILGLVESNSEMFGKCWICTVESYTSSLMMLFKLCQSLLLDTTNAENIMNPLSRSLSLLQVCANGNQVASMLFANLQPHINTAKRYLSPSFLNTPPLDVISGYQGLHHPLFIPPGDSPLHHTAKALLDLLSRPFDTLPGLPKDIPSTISVFSRDISLFQERQMKDPTPPHRPNSATNAIRIPTPSRRETSISTDSSAGSGLQNTGERYHRHTIPTSKLYGNQTSSSQASKVRKKSTSQSWKESQRKDRRQKAKEEAEGRYQVASDQHSTGSDVRRDSHAFTIHQPFEQPPVRPSSRSNQFSYPSFDH